MATDWHAFNIGKWPWKLLGVRRKFVVISSNCSLFVGPVQHPRGRVGGQRIEERIEHRRIRQRDFSGGRDDKKSKSMSTKTKLPQEVDESDLMVHPLVKTFDQ